MTGRKLLCTAAESSVTQGVLLLLEASEILGGEAVAVKRRCSERKPLEAPIEIRSTACDKRLE